MERTSRHLLKKNVLVDAVDQLSTYRMYLLVKLLF